MFTNFALMRLLKWSSFAFMLVFLTILTQIGGVILLLCYPIFRYMRANYHLKNIHHFLINVLIYSALYAPVCAWIVPPIAKHFGRIRLTAINKTILRPHSIWYSVLNRDYVVPKLAETAQRVATRMNADSSKTIVYFLDAAFPFRGMPLLPHLSHSDAHQLDVTFFYLNKNQQITNDKPSTSGYGCYEQPRVGEPQTNEYCKKKFKNKFYDFAQNMTFGSRKDLTFDPERTKKIIQTFAQDRNVRRIFLEPHLAKRLNFKSLDNIQPAGCQAARHDDHFHVQIY
jgi:Penicillin-insensitive murein endopeptidase